MKHSLQQHLDLATTVNLGSYYTPKELVDITYDLLEKHVKIRNFLFLDSSCGYGDFFTKDLEYIGADIDEIALAKNIKKCKKINTNSLHEVSRKKYNIDENRSLIIIGNPPYSDKTAMSKRAMKNKDVLIDEELKHRDLGISFLKSYNLLKPDYVAVLHPLSYLVKRSNFRALKEFKDNYILIDGLVVSSQWFNTRASGYFPILIALYKKDKGGMNYNYIENFLFKTIEGDIFRLKDFDFISNYVSKYPNKIKEQDIAGYFFPLRDINALKRNKTFVEKSDKMIKIAKEKLAYYYYIHHFKAKAAKLPYYLGNLDVFVDNEAFLKSEASFLNLGTNVEIENYFNKLFKKLNITMKD